MSREITNSEAIANLNHIYGFLSPNIQRSLDVAFKALEKQPQGDLADEVWKLYEKYHSHLATNVIEFGDELKDLLGKYQKGGVDIMIDRTYSDDPYEYMSQEPCDYCPYQNTDKCHEGNCGADMQKGG